MLKTNDKKKLSWWSIKTHSLLILDVDVVIGSNAIRLYHILMNIGYLVTFYIN